MQIERVESSSHAVHNAAPMAAKVAIKAGAGASRQAHGPPGPEDSPPAPSSASPAAKPVGPERVWAHEMRTVAQKVAIRRLRRRSPASRRELLPSLRPCARTRKRLCTRMGAEAAAVVRSGVEAAHEVDPQAEVVVIDAAAGDDVGAVADPPRGSPPAAAAAR